MTPVMRFASIVVLAFILSTSASAQSYKRPSAIAVLKAKTMLEEHLFPRLESGEADELAEWVTDQTHSEASGTTRTQSLSQFQTQFRMVLQGGPESPFGLMHGYDLIQEVSLPGTDRYFRLVYMTYHQRAPILWEVHFYVQPDDEVSVTYFQFNGQNPFVYLATPDMLIDMYYDKY